MEVRAARHDEEYVGWKVHMLGTKPGDMTAFIAVDDFEFKRGDEICMTLPEGAGTTSSSGTTVTPSSTSRPCSPDEVQCHDGTCLAPTKRFGNHLDVACSTLILQGATLRMTVQKTALTKKAVLSFIHLRTAPRQKPVAGPQRMRVRS